MNRSKFTLPVRERIARTISSYFTTDDIANIFNELNIQADKSLYAKWRIALDGFSKMSEPEKGIPHILEIFCHPLNFQNPQDLFARENFIEELNKILSYSDLMIQANNQNAVMISSKDGFPILDDNSPAFKTSTDYIYDALNFFKNEYNKVKISGLTYEYFLGENTPGLNEREYSEDYQDNLKAIKQLKAAGFITEYEIKVENNDAGSWVFAVCKIDENKITKKEEPPATEAGVREIIQKVEITSMPEVLFRNVEDTALVKGKRKIHLPNFQPTQWADATIRFLDERNVLIQGGKKNIPADYEALGFSDDKSKKPNLAWSFLFGMAKNNGETNKIPSPIPDNIKQIKRQISDFLKKIYKNETEPFYEFSETNTYKLKIKLIPPQTEDAADEDRFGINSYLEETMTSEYEKQANDN